MSLNSALIKDITHYFRPSIKSDKQSDGALRGENLGTSKFVQCDEDSKGYDCDLYLSESDDDLPVVTSKKKSHLVVQIPGLSACGSSQRKRKLKEETSVEVKKNKRQCDSPTVRHWKVTSDSENVEETFYMSPLRLESDSSPEGSPSGKCSPRVKSPVYCTSLKKKNSLRVMKNPFLAVTKNNAKPLSNPQNNGNSLCAVGSQAWKKNELLGDKGSNGSLHKYFENVSPLKSKDEISRQVKISRVSLTKVNPSALVITDSQGGGAKLNSQTVQTRHHQQKQTSINRVLDDKHSGENSILINSVDQSPQKIISKALRAKDGHEVAISSANKGEKKVFKGNHKDDSDCSKTNNLLKYFDKKTAQHNSKARKIKNKKGKRKGKWTVKDFSSTDATSKVESNVSLDQDLPSNLEVQNNGHELSCCSNANLNSVPKSPGNCGLDSDGEFEVPTSALYKKAVRKESVKITRQSTRREVCCRMTLRARKNSSVGVSQSEDSDDSSCMPKRTTGRKSGVKKKANLKERSVSHLKTSEKISQPKTKKMESKKAGNKVVKQRHNVSASQRSAARIVRRACQKRSVDKRVINSSPPIISTSDDVIILSEKLGSGETKKIVIRPSFVKLAPLFLAKEELQKKKFFLQSGAPEIVVRRMKEQKRIEIELEEASEYPSVSHTLQKDTSFPWCLDKNPKLAKKFSWVHVDHIEESERISSMSSKTLSLGNISGLPSFLASMLVYLRPPIPSITSPERSPVLSPNEDGLMSHCFCVGVSPDPANGKSHEYSASDVEMFERVHAWLMRSLLPPGVAFKMCVDLTSFLPIPTSSGFHNNHIVAIPSNSLGPLLRKQMLLKLKEEYPSFPVNRRYQMFYQRKKCAGGLHSYGELPVGNVITLDSTSPNRENGKFSHNKVESNGINEMMTPIALRRSRRRNNNDEPTSQAEVKSLADISSDVGGSSVLSINDTAVKATCSSLLSSECWSDIFAPASYLDACSLGRNLKTLDKLKSWLENWARRSSLKGSSRNKKKSGLSDSEEDYSSSIEFCSSDDDDETKENKSLPTNVAILIGSCGSGKTSSVYALAKEMNFKVGSICDRRVDGDDSFSVTLYIEKHCFNSKETVVLEINASSKRSGKYILATVKEATRSYQVMSSGGPSSSASIGSFFKKSSQNKTNDSIERKTLSKDTKSSGKASSAMSLIFVEDVDVVFENEDEGFIGALTSLTTSTKRPVILEVHTSKPLRMGTTNNWLLEEILTESCPHLINFLAKQNRTPLILPFERSRNNMYAEALLRIACLSEGVWVSKKWSETLFKHTAGDFRRAIQEAQFWAGSVARSSVLLDNLSRYPREVTQKGEILDSDSEDVIHRHAPVNLCGCVGKRACSYPYLWMYKDYIQEIWLKLDQIVDTALMAMQNAVYSRSKCDKASDSLNSPGSCEKSVVIGGKITLRDNSIIISPRRGTPLKSSPYEKHSISSGNIKIKTEELSTTDVKCRDLPVRQSQRANKGNRRYIHSLDRHMKFKHEMNSSPISISARRKIEFISENTPEGIVKDTSEKLNSLSSGQKSVAERQNFSKKTSIVIFSDYLDLLCTSDVLLKKFNNAGNLEVGQNLVFEMGNLANLINMSMQVSTSEKSREMEAKQAKDSYTAAQYQMILPIVPDYWLLNCPVLAMDVAPHIRETCRILDELTKSGKTRTRLSHRIPTINRIGPTLREALIKTLVDDSNMNALLKVEANPLKNNDE